MAAAPAHWLKIKFQWENSIHRCFKCNGRQMTAGYRCRTHMAHDLSRLFGGEARRPGQPHE